MDSTTWHCVVHHAVAIVCAAARRQSLAAVALRRVAIPSWTVVVPCTRCRSRHTRLVRRHTIADANAAQTTMRMDVDVDVDAAAAAAAAAADAADAAAADAAAADAAAADAAAASANRGARP